MKIIKAYPPNYAELVRAFPIKGVPRILFAFGERLYNPSGIPVPPWLMSHELTHGQRQLEGRVLRHTKDDPVMAWWDLYIRDAYFRYEEELVAHIAEWEAYTMAHRNEWDRDNYLALISQRLASKLYGGLITEQEARDAITGGNAGSLLGGSAQGTRMEPDTSRGFRVLVVPDHQE